MYYLPMKPEDWACELIRLSIFPAPEMTPGNAESIYRAFTNMDAENASRKGLATEASGFVDDVQVTISSTLVRIDAVTRSKLAVDETPIENIPTLGPFPAALSAFVSRAKNWAGVMGDLSASRVALGAVLLVPETTKASGYSRLAELLKIKIDGKSSDFLYQINRRRTSRHFEDVDINRLTKWSVAKFVLMAITAGASKQAVESYSSRLELDINSAPETERVFNGSNVQTLIDEFANLATEISEHGDVE